MPLARLKCSKAAIQQLKLTAFEKGLKLQDATLEAINDYLAKNKAFLERGIMIAK
jgi:hypothetical protein